MKLLTFALALSLGSGAFAQSADQSNSTTIKASDVAPAKTNDIDNEITNAKLRAESGSKSKISMKADINYNGGSLTAPLSDVRPNYAGVAGADGSTSLNGQIGLAYRISDHDAIRLGTGIFISKPLQDRDGDWTNSMGKHTADVSNPYLDYSHAFRVSNVQNIFDANVTQYTQNFYTQALMMNQTVDMSHTMAWDFESTKWSPGVNVDVNYTTFKDAPQASDVLAMADAGRVDLEVGIFPYVEYAFTDALSFRTVARFLTYDHYRSDASNMFLREMWTQSVGIGYAITRDIYLYPNAQFAPEFMAPERTNIGLSTTINL